MTRRISVQYLATAVIAIAVAAGLFLGEAAAAAERAITCVPVEVAAFTTSGKRIHVKCAQSVNGISFFALSGNDAALAARILTILTTAQVAGRTLTISYDPADTSGQAWGCRAHDCRTIRGVWFGQ